MSKNTIHTLHITDVNGDTPVEFDPAVLTEVAVARAEFERMLVGGYTAFMTNEEGLGEFVKTFDPSIETIVLTGPVMGG